MSELKRQPDDMHMEHILYDTVEYKKTCGIYFLTCNGDVVYVGQSKNCEQRIQQHKDKIFDGYYIKELPLEDIDSEEEKYIYKYAPIYNKRVKLSDDNSILVTADWIYKNRHDFVNRNADCSIIDGIVYFKKEDLFICEFDLDKL